MQQHLGYYSEEDGYVIENYPWGFRLRTQIRYWIETREGFGQRFCSQTMNPKTHKWCAPKAGTYSPVIVMGLVDDDPDRMGYMTHEALSIYSDDKEIDAFVAEYELDDFQEKQIKFLKAKNKVSESLTWTFKESVNGEEVPHQTIQEQNRFIGGLIMQELAKES